MPVTRPLNPLECALWIAQASDPADVSTHIHRAVWLGIRIDPGVAADRLGRLASSMPVLRRSFPADDTTAHCRVQAIGTLADWVHSHPAAGWADEIIDQCVRQRFDLAAAPLVRVHILTSASEDGVVLVFVAHHLLVDGLSFDLLTSELLRVLIAERDDYVPAPQPEMPPGIQARPADPQLWRHLLGPLPEHNASLRPYRSQAASAPDTCTVKYLSADFMNAASRARAKLGCSISSILLGIYSAALLRVLDMPELLMMTQIDVRTKSQRDAMGMMINTVPVHIKLDGEARWTEFLAAVNRGAVEALRHRHVPLQNIIALAKPERRADRSSVFTDFEFTTVRQWEPPAEIQLRGIPVRTFERPDPATRYGLSINVALGAGDAHVRWAAKSAYYDAADVDLLQQAAESLAADLAHDPLRQPARADVMPAADVTAIRALGTGPQRPIPIQGWLTRLSRNCARIPDAPAIKHGDSIVSYAQLGSMISGIIRELAASGIAPGDRVAIHMSRGPGHIAALLAVLQAGAAYVPIDRANPPARVAELLAITAPNLVISDKPLDVASGLRIPAQVMDISDRIQLWQSAGGMTLGPDGCRRHPADAAYILFTSGSTGVPKGVEVGIRAFVNHLLMMEETLGLDEGAIVGQTAPLAFDVHVWQCVAPLLAGGTIAVYDESILRDPRQFVRQAALDQVTVLELVPSYLSALLTAHAFQGGEQALTGLELRQLISTGESLSGDLASGLQAAFPALTLLNAYGPAEAADDVTLAPVRGYPVTGVVPIGWPERNVEMLVVDRFHRLRPPGFIGQLAICGQVLANGYLNDPDSTAFGVHPYDSGSRSYLTGDRCVLDPSAGFVHLGRSDDQVKVGGRRVELGEIDAALTSIPGVVNAATITRTTSGPSYLLAKVVLDPGTTIGEVRRQAAALLPAYMVPAVIELAAELPLGRTGKVDRNRLAHDADRDPPSLPDRLDDLAALVREVWTSVLPPDSVAAAPFFASGGDSLRAMDLIVRLQAKGIPATINQIYQHQDFDGFVESVRLSPVDTSHPGVLASGAPPTPRQEEMLAEMAAGAPVPVQSVIFTSSASLPDIHDAVQALVARHPELRLCFDHDQDGRPTMQVRPADDPDVYPALVRLPDGSPQLDADPRLDADPDGALLRLAAGQLDVRAGKQAGLAALSSGPACLAVSHLVCDIVSLRTLILELDDLLAAPAENQVAGGASSSFLPWARQLAQLRRAEVPAGEARYRSAVQVASEQVMASWLTTRPQSGGSPPGALAGTVRVAERWPAGLGDEDVRLVAVAAVALAMHRVTGASPVRIDLDLDGRRVFETVGVSGVGVGCFTLVSPVLIDLDTSGPDSQVGRGLVEHVQVALASRPPDAAWDSAMPQDAAAQPTSAIAPLVNVVGRSLQLGGLSTLTACRAPAGVPAHNATSDPHPVTVDVVLRAADDRPGQEIEFLITPRPADRAGLADQLIAALPSAVGEAVTLAAARPLGRRPGAIPDGLELLDLSPAEAAELLAAVLEAEPDRDEG
jgi:amino acid adenylation domain-containing protein